METSSAVVGVEGLRVTQRAADPKAFRLAATPDTTGSVSYSTGSTPDTSADTTPPPLVTTPPSSDTPDGQQMGATPTPPAKVSQLHDGHSNSLVTLGVLVLLVVLFLRSGKGGKKSHSAAS